MGLIDITKRLHARAVSWRCPVGLVFHHVPKCGGTSVGRALRTRFALSQTTIHPESTFRALELWHPSHSAEQLHRDVLDFRELLLLYHLHLGTRCIAAHVRFSPPAFEAYHGAYRFCTVLREPTSRFLSHYFWSHKNRGAHAHIAEEFPAFLTTDRARRMGATYAEFFSGLPSNADVTCREAIERSILNLRRLDLVGFLDDLSRFASEFRVRFGYRLRLRHANRATYDDYHRRTRELCDDHGDAIRQLCGPDWAIYDALRQAGVTQHSVKQTVEPSIQH